MITYHAARLSQCTKALVADRLGYDPLPPSGKMKELFDEGRRLEDIVIERLYGEYDWYTYDRQIELTIPITETVELVGHPDGKVKPCYPLAGNVTLPKAKLLEVKSSRNYDEIVELGWETPGIFQNYKWQVSAYMLATEMELVLVLIDGTPELDDYERRIHFFHVEEPFYTMSDLRARVLTAEHWARKGELPSECDRKYYPCPFVYLHEDEKVEIIDDAQIDALAIQYKQAQRDEKAAKEKTAKTRKALEEGIGEEKWSKDKDGKLRLQTKEGVKIVRYQQNNPVKWDVNQMVLDGMDVEKYRKQEKGWRMRVEVEEDNG